MFKTLYCHIGAGKTGTSSIQGSLFWNPKSLEKHGVFAIKRPGVTILPTMVKDPQKLFPVRARNLSDDELPRIHNRARNNLKKVANGDVYDTCILSTEHCLGLPRQAVSKLHEFLTPFADEVKVIYYARHPYTKIPSSFNQWIKTGSADLDRPLRNYLRGFREELANWITVFGVENVIVRKFEVEDMTHKSPVADFCETIGKPELFEELTVRRTNEAISAPATIIASALNIHLRKTGEERGPYEFLTKIAGPKFTLPKERLLEIDAEIQAQVDFLSDTFGIKLKTPDFAEHDASPQNMFTDEVLLSIGKVMNDQALEIKKLKAKLKT